MTLCRAGMARPSARLRSKSWWIGLGVHPVLLARDACACLLLAQCQHQSCMHWCVLRLMNNLSLILLEPPCLAGNARKTRQLQLLQPRRVGRQQDAASSWGFCPSATRQRRSWEWGRLHRLGVSAALMTPCRTEGEAAQGCNRHHSSRHVTVKCNLQHTEHQQQQHLVCFYLT